MFCKGFLPHEGSPIVCVCHLGVRCAYGILCAPFFGRRIIVNLFELGHDRDDCSLVDLFLNLDCPGVLGEDAILVGRALATPARGTRADTGFGL